MKLPIIEAVSKQLQAISKTASKKSPTLLTGIAVLGTVTSIILTHKATKDAVKKMDEVRSDDEYEPPESKMEELFEEVKETWQYYIPVVIVASVTIVSEIQSNRINLKRIAILTDAYRMSENLRKEYQEKVKEIIGENKEEKIRTELAQDELIKDPPKDNLIYDTGEGRVIFKDKFTGRYFYHDPEKMRQAKNRFDAKLLAEDYASLNEWYYMIKLEPLDDVGTMFGWNMEQLDRHDLSDIQLIPGVTHEGIPCFIVSYDVELNYDMFEPS